MAQMYKMIKSTEDTPNVFFNITYTGNDDDTAYEVRLCQRKADGDYVSYPREMCATLAEAIEHAVGYDEEVNVHIDIEE